MKTTKFVFSAAIALVIGLAPILSRATEGGIDGGGGGTLPANPVSTYYILQIVQKSKPHLRLVLNYLDWSQRISSIFSDETKKKLFTGTPSLLDTIETTDIEVPVTKPCYDSAGNEVDGSVHASKPNTICISAFRIAPKLIEERATIETEALILHELSHVLGANESEAVELQQYAAQLLQGSDFQKIDLKIQSVGEDLSNLVNRGFLDGLEKNFEHMSNEDLQKGLTTLLSQESELSQKTTSQPFFFFNGKQYDYQMIMGTRLSLAAIWLNSQPGMPVNDYWNEIYTKVFQSDTEVTYKDYELRQFGSVRSENQYASYVIKRITSRNDLKAELLNIKKYFSGIENYFDSIRFGNELLAYDGPWTNPTTTNPWLKFIGNYSASKISCSASGYREPWLNEVTTVSITQDGTNPETLKMSFGSPGMTWTFGYLYTGASSVLGGVVKVSGDSQSASYREFRGTNWSNSSDGRVVSLGSSSGKMIFQVHAESRRWEYSGDNIATSDCSFELLKTN